MKRSQGPNTLVYPMPVFLIGTYDAAGQPNIMTAAWGGICCSEPPMLAVSVRKPRWTYAALMERKAFTVSIPSVRLVKEADYAGISSGRNNNKFAKLSLNAVRAELVDAPYVDECPVVLELVLAHTLELGSHVQFIGEIKDVKVEEDCLDAQGVPDIAKIDPVQFDSGGRRYTALGREVGKAFSIGKVFMGKDEA